MGDAVQPIGEILFILGALVVLGGSIALVLSENNKAADTNRKLNMPISNGLAIPATIILFIILTLVVLVGFLPPIFRRG